MATAMAAWFAASQLIRQEQLLQTASGHARNKPCTYGCNVVAHRNFAHNKNGAKFAPKIPGVLDASNVPNCAGCEGLNPFVNPFDATHSSSFVGDTRNAGLLAGHQAGFRAAAPRRPAQAQQAARPQASRPLAADPRLFTTTQRPIRQFPPGKLALNRFETGFNFDFSS